MKKLFVALTIISCCLVSCQKKADFTYDHRTYQSKPFVERELPAGLVIGKNLPSAAEAVDLGLSVKWANMFVGAQTPEEFGTSFAWGEIKESSNYCWANYEYNDYHTSDASTLYLTKYCFDLYGEYQDCKEGAELNKFDDPAYLYWGEHWRMPTKDEVWELKKSCTWKFVYNEDKPQESYYTVTGSNGNSIKLYVKGTQIGVPYPNDGRTGGFWASNLSTPVSTEAVYCGLDMDTDLSSKGKKTNVNVMTTPRCYGLQIRPVYVD